MDSTNHNTSLRTNKHLSYEERFFIEKQLQAGVSKTAIANALGRS
ncbi:helix-turn-helix domain-containing protein, partial [Veillonella ratti]